MVDDEATFAQRRALHNMYSALGWKLDGIRDMSKAEASRAISETKKYINEHGFPKPKRGREEE